MKLKKLTICVEKLNVENFEWIAQKNYGTGWMGGWKEVEAEHLCWKFKCLKILSELREKTMALGGWVDGRKEGSKSRVKDCLQQSEKK